MKMVERGTFYEKLLISHFNRQTEWFFLKYNKTRLLPGIFQINIDKSQLYRRSHKQSVVNKSVIS